MMRIDMDDRAASLIPVHRLKIINDRRPGLQAGRVSISPIWIDELRISNGWRENIDPYRRLKADRWTVALWHFDEGRETMQSLGVRPGRPRGGR